MKKLAELPNQEGFEFIGIDEDRNEFLCVVAKNSVGCHCVYEKSTKNPCFMKLSGWIYTGVGKSNDK